LFRRILCHILGCRAALAPVVQWELTFPGGRKLFFTGDWTMNVKDNEGPFGVKVTWVDAKGKKAKVDPNTPLTLSSSDENVMKPVTLDDGSPGFAVGALDGIDADDNGLIGTASLAANADADLGDGTQAVAAVGAVNVLAGDAATGSIELVPAPTSTTAPTP
jgi:hypothetical protein